MASLGKSLIHGFFWASGGQTMITVISLIANILLARILSPDEFGLLGIILFFTALANVFIAGGLAGALVRLPETTEDDCKTIFTFNLLVSIFCYILLVVFAPAIAKFYNQPQLSSLIVVSGLVLFINAFQLVNTALLVRKMRFKERALYQILATFLASLAAIICAYFGMGVWSLIVLQLGTQFLITLQVAIFEPFFIQLGWSKDSFRKLYSFGVNTTLANLLNTAFLNIYQLVLGKYFSIMQVGYLYQAQKLERVPNNILNYFVQNVLYSGMAKLQDDIEAFRKAYNKVVRILTVMVGLMTIFTFIYSRQLINLLYGSKWEHATIYLQLLIIASFFYMQEQFNRVIFKVFDRTGQILVLEIVKKSIQAITVVVGVIYKDIMLLMGGLILTNIISVLINYYYSRKIISDYKELLNVTKVIFAGVISVICVSVFHSVFSLTNFFSFFSIPVLIAIYFGLLQMIGGFNFKEDIMSVKHILKNKKNEKAA